MSDVDELLSQLDSIMDDVHETYPKFGQTTDFANDDDVMKDVELQTTYTLEDDLTRMLQELGADGSDGRRASMMRHRESRPAPKFVIGARTSAMISGPNQDELLQEEPVRHQERRGTSYGPMNLGASSSSLRFEEKPKQTNELDDLLNLINDEFPGNSSGGRARGLTSNSEAPPPGATITRSEADLMGPVTDEELAFLKLDEAINFTAALNDTQKAPEIIEEIKQKQAVDEQNTRMRLSSAADREDAERKARAGEILQRIQAEQKESMRREQERVEVQQYLDGLDNEYRAEQMDRDMQTQKRLEEEMSALQGMLSTEPAADVDGMMDELDVMLQRNESKNQEEEERKRQAEEERRRLEEEERIRAFRRDKKNKNKDVCKEHDRDGLDGQFGTRSKSHEGMEAKHNNPHIKNITRRS
eukprot:TRINITY_DN629_c0_g1_i1.p2 TRINITY_DN629_c0_g1~~TRINITY_DN629_c0_g1_i1.p2  ORF type:complete len:416 (+),score=127.08 TRINITY_DN629_c0_g1_i1:87-1334(+)